MIKLLAKIVKKLVSSFFDLPLLIILILALAWWIVDHSKSVSIKKLSLPKIPSKILQIMDAQIKYETSCSDSGFDWFSFYDSNLKSDVEVKLSGLCSPHFHSFSNKSLRFKYESENLRLKSLSSEVHPKNMFEPFSLLFTEYAIYNIAKEFYPYVPQSEIVMVNDNVDDIYIKWDDNFENVVREKDTVSWQKLAKNFLYAKDRQARYFPEMWKDKNFITDNPGKDFSELLEPFLEKSDKPVDSFVETKLNLDNYLNYLALNSVFSSSHMDSHNLFFSLDTSKENQAWNMYLYDLSGLNYNSPPLPLINLNYISELFLRNPYYTHLYFERLYDLTKKVLGNEKISNFYKRLEQDNYFHTKEFAQVLIQTGNRWNLPGDINGFYQSIGRIESYEKIRYLDLMNKMSIASLHWNLFTEDGKQYLALSVSSPVGVEIKELNCGWRSCLKDWEMINPPWWLKKEALLLPEFIRWKGGGLTETKNKTKLLPQEYRYLYLWNSKKTPPLPKDIKIKAVNAVTGEKIIPAYDDRPVMTIETGKSDEGQYSHYLKVHIGNNNSEPIFSEDSSLDSEDWVLTVSSGQCQSTKKDNLNYIFDCSKINLANWPYPLNYLVSLFYRGMKIQEKRGEFFQDYVLPPEAKILNTEDLEKYRISSAVLVKTPEYRQLVSESWSKQDQFLDKLESFLEKARNIYFLPAGSKYELKNDLILGDGSLIWLNQGTELIIWPLVSIETDFLVSTGSEQNKVIFKGKAQMPRWYGIGLRGGGYIGHTEIISAANILQGAVHNLKEPINLVIKNAHFLANRNNITCVGCEVVIEDSIFNAGEYLLNLTESNFLISNIDCLKTDHCFKLTDSEGEINGFTANKIKDRVFQLEGKDSFVKIKNGKVNGASIFLSSKNQADFSYEPSDVKIEKVKMVVANLDDLE